MRSAKRFYPLFFPCSYYRSHRTRRTRSWERYSSSARPSWRKPRGCGSTDNMSATSKSSRTTRKFYFCPANIRFPCANQGTWISLRRWSWSRGSQLKLQVTPERAAVFLDNGFVGTVHEFSGVGRGMLVSPGKHRVKIALPGYQAFESEVNLLPPQKITIKTNLVPGSITQAGPSIKKD